MSLTLSILLKLIKSSYKWLFKPNVDFPLTFCSMYICVYIAVNRVCDGGGDDGEVGCELFYFHVLPRFMCTRMNCVTHMLCCVFAF